MAINNNQSKIFAYDISKKVISKGIALNQDAINASIENILFTVFGERIFNLEFGAILMSSLFENIDKNSGNDLLDKLTEAIEKWEDRVFVYKNLAKIQIITDLNQMILTIPYFIIQNNLTGTFQKKITFSA